MRKIAGFTIVELIVVIMIIAILATLTIVSYNGVQQSARDKAVLSDIDGVESELARYAYGHAGQYGTVLSWYTGSNGATTNSNISFTPTKGTVIDVVASVTQYCIRAYNTGGSTYKDLAHAAYKESTPGACTTLTPSAGALADSPIQTAPVLPTITNYVLNPSVETNTTGLSGANGTTIVRTNALDYSGTASVQATMPIGSGSALGVTLYNPGSTTVPSYLAANSNYTASVWVYVPSATATAVKLSVQGTGRAAFSCPASCSTSVKDTWVRLSAPFTTGTSGSIVVYVINVSATTVAGQQFWADATMITDGTTLYNYADGDSSGWVWNDTSNAKTKSTSTGPGTASS